MATMRDLTVHEGLSIVKLDGFEKEPEYLVDESGGRHKVDEFDPIGSANWLCEAYGMANDCQADTGILYSDYDGWRGGPWDFSLLIATEDAEALAELARENDYYVEGIESVTEPTSFGDGHQGTVEILRHREGWVILEN